MDDVGVPTYNELVDRRARAGRALARAAAAALHARARARPRGAARRTSTPASTRSSRPTPTSSASLQRAQVKATLPVFFPTRQGPARSATRTRARGRRYTQWMLDNDLLASPAGANRAFTNEFLPGEGI